MKHRIKAGLIALALAAATLTACGSDESREDADDVGNGRVDKSAPHVVAFNNHYPNIEHKCLVEGALEGQGGDDGPGGTGLRVIVTTSKAVLVVADPHCPGYQPEQAGTSAVTPAPLTQGGE